MGRDRFKMLTMGFIVLIMLVVVLLMANSLRRTSHVTLPDSTGQTSGETDDPQHREDAVNTVDITPRTVQAAIATLERPEAYTQTLTAERLWEESSTLLQITVQVSGGQTRVDTTRENGRTRCVLTDGETTAIWYDQEESFYIGRAGDVTADQEQTIPTYEDILDLDPGRIAAADYRAFAGEACIYTETFPDDLGIVHRYWVSVSSGLLIGAERLEGEIPFYRMAAQETSTEVLPADTEFLLPDGSSLSEH